MALKTQLLLFYGVRVLSLTPIFSAALVSRVIFPSPIVAFPFHELFGIALIFITKLSDYESIKAFWTAGGTFMYNHPPSKVVNGGPYLYIRNPLYLTLFIDTFALFLIFGSIMYLSILILMIIGVHIVVVAKEEPQLERRFGETYLIYKRKVPRWIPKIAITS
jgi:protein-S-isoprenylcysteine O-methyltransferase Ste14